MVTSLSSLRESLVSRRRGMAVIRASDSGVLGQSLRSRNSTKTILFRSRSLIWCRSIWQWNKSEMQIQYKNTKIHTILVFSYLIIQNCRCGTYEVLISLTVRSVISLATHVKNPFAAPCRQIHLQIYRYS